MSAFVKGAGGAEDVEKPSLCYPDSFVAAESKNPRDIAVGSTSGNVARNTGNRSDPGGGGDEDEQEAFDTGLTRPEGESCVG